MVRMIAWRRTVSLERHPLPARPAAGEDRLRGDKRSRPPVDQYLHRLNQEFRFIAHALDSPASNNVQESEILGFVADSSQTFRDLQEVLSNGDFQLFRSKLPTVGAEYLKAAGSPRCKCLAYSVGIIPQRMSRFKIFSGRNYQA